MSRVDEKEAAVKFMMSELQGEGVRISEKAARFSVEKHFKKPPHRRSRIPRDFEAIKEARMGTGN